MIVGIKLGSKTLTDGKGIIYEDFIQSVCDQLVLLKQKGYRPFLVTSGAVAAYPDKTMSKNARAGVGQSILMEIYNKYLYPKGFRASQHLYTDRDLHERDQITKQVLEELLDHPCIIPVLNANDVVYSRELEALQHCADNDVLFRLVCLLVGVHVALIGIPEKGFCDEQGRKLDRINSRNSWQLNKYIYKGNDLGHGGMEVKKETMTILRSYGVLAMLVNTTMEDFILKGVEQDQEVGTIFV